MTLFYKYVDIPEEEDIDGDIPLEGKIGNVNPAYKEDEKLQWGTAKWEIIIFMCSLIQLVRTRIIAI